MITGDEFHALCSRYQGRAETRGAFLDYVQGKFVSNRDLHCAADALKRATESEDSRADMDAIIGFVGHHWKAFD